MDKFNLESYQRFASLLKGIEAFVIKHPKLNYIEFDYYVVHDMTLFSIEPSFNFEQLTLTIEKIKKSIPASKRIFSKPIIVLKDSDDVLPVENTRIINQNTLQHLANHSQHVSNITKKGVKPRKLLTRIYEDDYAIYENIVFCNYMDTILQYANKNGRILNSVIYASDVMAFNLLEKSNHLKYFLALGKLHTGYIRDFSQYVNLSRDLLQELDGITNTIFPRLKKPVYKLNERRNKNLPLKKTNIFLMQKDYRLVYKSFKYLQELPTQKPDLNVEVDENWMRKTYMLYVSLLSVFSAGHFNFQLESKSKMNVESLNTVFQFKDWQLTINNQHQFILLYFKKDVSYRMMIVDSDATEDFIKKEMIKRRIHEVVKVDPLDEDYFLKDSLYISLSDIDSFRRIQQVILRGMIYSDQQKTVCPFCGGKLAQHKRYDYLECKDCFIQIKADICENTNASYYYTDIPNRKKEVPSESILHGSNKWYLERQMESSMYFKNITKIDKEGQLICPKCHQVHKKI